MSSCACPQLQGLEPSEWLKSTPLHCALRNSRAEPDACRAALQPRPRSACAHGPLPLCPAGLRLPWARGVSRRTAGKARGVAGQESGEKERSHADKLLCSVLGFAGGEPARPRRSRAWGRRAAAAPLLCPRPLLGGPGEGAGRSIGRGGARGAGGGARRGSACPLAVRHPRTLLGGPREGAGALGGRADARGGAPCAAVAPVRRPCGTPMRLGGEPPLS